ncbi:M28 family peptidase [Capnocytophaga sp. ARDL2]|uniref:M28 family peptidase n=1 Tax=Capnocytophaga sp. ARDL2 TaxID=3238809 RepID=UPI003557C82E
MLEIFRNKVKLFALLLIVSCKTVDSVSVEKNSYSVKEEDVIETLRYLSSDELQGRDTGTEGIEKAAVFLENHLKNNSIAPYFVTYRDTLSNYNPTAYNIVGLIEGKDSELKHEIVILGAHYDHIGMNENLKGDKIYNGANDNASSVTIVSEIAKYLATQENKRSVLICYFSAEEKGLLGAKHLATKLKEQGINLYVMLNFEMMGVPMQNRNFDMFITGPKISNLWKKMNEYAASNLVGEIPHFAQFFKASDNYPFYTEFKVPSHTVCTFDFENFQYYHQPQDEFELMDTRFMTQTTQKLLPVISKIVNSDKGEIRCN